MFTNQVLLSPDPKPLTTANNSFVSQWFDKRSAPFVSLSVVIRGTGTIAGAITFETSNAIDGGLPGQPGGGGGYGQPAPGASGTTGNPDDYVTFPSVSLAVAAQGSFQWNPEFPVGARWVRARYTATTSAAGQTASVYANAAFSS
jgi:hypothetical protein